MKVATRRLLEEQIAVVVALGSGERSDAMWHVPHWVTRGALVANRYTYAPPRSEMGSNVITIT